RHIQAQIDYAESLGYPAWGMSPCSKPDGSYDEFGVKPVGVLGYPSDLLTPHATFLALPFSYEASLANLRDFVNGFPGIYGDYDFYGSVDPHTGTISYRSLASDQAMTFLGLANTINRGKIYKRLRNDPLSERIELLLKAENPLPY